MLRYHGTSYGPVSVTSQCSIKPSGLISGMEAFFDLSYMVLQGNVQKKGTPLSNFILNYGLRKFVHSTFIIKTCCQLGSTQVDAQSMINWTVGQLS